jgi:hypothetical protein
MTRRNEHPSYWGSRNEVTITRPIAVGAIMDHLFNGCSNFAIFRG